MSTGLTFGTIASLYGLNAGIIDKTQFSLLVTVVVLSAVVPTALAERWFLPDTERELRVTRTVVRARRPRSSSRCQNLASTHRRIASCAGCKRLRGGAALQRTP